uniref:Uncharacterized protein n=1 Tax=Arion vulgaris TaxID=1028688 RepID=A0A0B7AD99_9EUPU
MHRYGIVQNHEMWDTHTVKTTTDIDDGMLVVLRDVGFRAHGRTLYDLLLSPGMLSISEMT